MTSCFSLVCFGSFFFCRLFPASTITAGNYSFSEAEKLVDFSVLLDLFSLQDVTSLTPLSPEIISRQATINIGMELLDYILDV